MFINQATGLLEDVPFIRSPNCNERPKGTAVDLLVVHGISLPPGVFGGKDIDALFTNQLLPDEHPSFQSIAHLKVSAHVLIRRTGDCCQFVPFSMRAWHAGESNFAGRPECNDFSIGIELEGADEVPYDVAQYQRLVELIRSIRQVYPAITEDRIVGHSDIAPGRKTDPGPAFNWHYLRNLLKTIGSKP